MTALATSRRPDAPAVAKRPSLWQRMTFSGSWDDHWSVAMVRGAYRLVISRGAAMALGGMALLVLFKIAVHLEVIMHAQIDATRMQQAMIVETMRMAEERGMQSPFAPGPDTTAPVESVPQPTTPASPGSQPAGPTP